MKVYIFTDLEGATGVVDYDYGNVKRRKKDREFLISDVNAAIMGGCEAGAEAVTVYDGHGKDAVQLEKLDNKAALIKKGKAESYLPGLDSSYTHLVLIGFHSMAGSGGLLSHTESLRIKKILINGRKIGEIGISFLYATRFEVQPAFISGDDKAVSEARLYLPNIPAAEVKRTISERCGECLTPSVTSRLIRKGVCNALTNGESSTPDLPSPPFEMKVIYKNCWTALPRYFLKNRFDGVALENSYTLSFKDHDVVQLLKKFMGSYKRSTAQQTPRLT